MSNMAVPKELTPQEPPSGWAFRCLNSLGCWKTGCSPH